MKAIQTILENDSALQALIGTEKVFFSYAPQKTALPYVLVISSVDNTNPTMSGNNLDEHQVQVFSVGEIEYTNGDKKGAREIGDAVRTALDGVKGSYGSPAEVVDIEFDSDVPIRFNTKSQDPNKMRFELEQIYNVFKRR